MGGKGGQMLSPPIFILPKNIFVAVELKRGIYKNCGEGGERGGCMYFKVWFKPIFPHFLTWPPRK